MVNREAHLPRIWRLGNGIPVFQVETKCNVLESRSKPLVKSSLNGSKIERKTLNSFYLIYSAVCSFIYLYIYLSICLLYFNVHFTNCQRLELLFKFLQTLTLIVHSVYVSKASGPSSVMGWEVRDFRKEIKYCIVRVYSIVCWRRTRMRRVLASLDQTKIWRKE